MSNEPTDPNDNSGLSTTTDTSIVESVDTSVPTSQEPTDNVNSLPLQQRADGSWWDPSTNTYVSINNTNIGTTSFET